MSVVKCSEPERFQPAAQWTSQGLATEDQVRSEMLWQAATADTEAAKLAKEHAEGCDYCSDVLDRFRRAAYAFKPGQAVQFAVCPATSQLFDYHSNSLPPEIHAKVAAHVLKCEQCRKDAAWIADSERRSTRPVIMTPRAWQITMVAAAAALLIACIGLFAVRTRNNFTPILDQAYSAKYRDLAKLPLIDRADLLSAAPPSHWPALDKAISALELGDNQRAVSVAARIINTADEPAAEYVMGRALYRGAMLSSAKEALTKSESMQPMSSYRCWSALQIGLILGDKGTIQRECKHLAGDPVYGGAVAKIQEELKKRG